MGQIGFNYCQDEMTLIMIQNQGPIMTKRWRRSGIYRNTGRSDWQSVKNDL